MIRVDDIERSAAFYRLLGFEIGNRVPRIGPPHWAWLHQPQASNLEARGELDAGSQRWAHEAGLKDCFVLSVCGANPRRS
jgi:catechol 2,3-dioxygenase-like lactoylglutathione lyase family enzyme